MGDDIPTLTGTSPTEHTGAGYQGSNIGLGEGLERQQSRESEAVRSRWVEETQLRKQAHNSQVSPSRD